MKRTMMAVVVGFVLGATLTTPLAATAEVLMSADFAPPTCEERAFVLTVTNHSDRWRRFTTVTFADGFATGSTYGIRAGQTRAVEVAGPDGMGDGRIVRAYAYRGRPEIIDGQLWLRNHERLDSISYFGVCE